MASQFRWGDAALYLASLFVALGTARWESIPLPQRWGVRAIFPYAAGTAAAVVLALAWARIPSGFRSRLRVALAIAVLGGALALPLAREVGDRAEVGRATHAQSEVLITEEAAAALMNGTDPYAASYDEGPLAGWPPGTRHHVPYLPGELVFGLPHALGVPARLADPRPWFLAGAMISIGAAIAIARPRRDRALLVVMILLVLPTGARSAVGGGDDLSVIALLLLSLALLDRRRPISAGIAAGVAAAMKQTAWPLLPFLVLAARDARGARAGGRALAGAAAPIVLAVVPFLLWHPGAFIEDVVLFPLGLAGEPTQAASPTLGRLLSNVLPGAVALLPLAAVGVFIVIVLVRRPELTPRQAAAGTALLLTAAILLSTAGRFGYLIYPLNLLVWSRLVLRRSAAEPRARQAPRPLPALLARRGTAAITD